MSGSVRIAGWGNAEPPVRVAVTDIEARLGLAPGWLSGRTGIQQLRYASPDQTTSDLAAEAASTALRCAGAVPPLGLLLLATSTPDQSLPPTAPRVAARLGLRCGAVDLAGACCGFLSALALGHAHCAMRREAVLVVAANILSRRVDPADAATVGLFADAAGAVVLVPSDGPDCLLAVQLASDGGGYERIGVPAGGRFIQMNGPGLFRAAVAGMVRVGTATLERARLQPADVDWWVPHQANERLIRDAGERIGIPAGRTVSIVSNWGNSSAATIPLALALAAADDRLRRGQTLLLTAVGAGMLEAGAVVRW